ncbi:hypothetical protein FK178_04735 [Antarcticibacterium arcticum]|uniref:STAS/SEC14 domain-containing protein n=1 Tax=Antarcticibacterium arcticum TaxID=2585771 RepID=A0A5B8YJ19_9FLAO|nr:hypothetical protein [Antarcticibacterium arcticum]QED37058.1 hypothetical protein FK178_04735 [Antarcticibacterium arcticum]
MIEQILELDFGKVWFKDNILIAELNEGILLDVESNRKLLAIGKKNFGDDPYGYISYRINSYAVNPMVYLDSASISNLKAIAVVSTSDMCRNNAVLERQFYKDSNSFEVFETLEEAVSWIKSQLRG